MSVNGVPPSRSPSHTRLAEIVNDYAAQLCGFMDEQEYCFGVKRVESEGAGTKERRGGFRDVVES